MQDNNLQEGSEDAASSSTSGGEQKERGLYIMMLSIHGLVRGEEPELGRDPDTGGQVLYVLDLARALGERDDVEQVDLVTRRIPDRKVADIYAQRYEELNDKARIVRFHFGPRRYLRKERLWPYLDAMTDRIVQYIREQGRIPDIIHGHYADAGYVGGQLARMLGAPFVFTGHSLGREKRRRLLDQGKSADSIEKTYNMKRRIEAEEYALETAALVVTSTRQEQDKQYSRYEHYLPKQMRIIPPGVDLSRFQPPGKGSGNVPFKHEINRFLRDPKKPMILAISRADERKNLETLLEAYGGSRELQRKANLVVIAGNREDINDLEPGARRVINRLLHQVDLYDLYGEAAYPKEHDPDDIPDIYRLAARTRGVFINPALTEPFGLTLLEAAASGLPIVATNDGGPRDILNNCKNGRLIDPLDVEDIRAKLLDSLNDRYRWRRWSKNGVKNVHKYYAWRRHVEAYLKEVRRIMRGARLRKVYLPRKSVLPLADRLLISDIDGTLLGDKKALRELMERINEQHGRTGFGIATGRRVDSALNVLKKHGVRTPDVLISCVGAEIYYASRKVRDLSWVTRLDYKWNPDKIQSVLADVEGLELQKASEQRHFKISYNIVSKKAPNKQTLYRLLRNQGLSVTVIYSHGAYVDILPQRASKGMAVRHIAFKWGIPLERILVAGDSGNDAEMLGGDVLGVVVGNHSPELEELRGWSRVRFTEGKYAAGVLEGLDHYDFFGNIQTRDQNDD